MQEFFDVLENVEVDNEILDDVVEQIEKDTYLLLVNNKYSVSYKLQDSEEEIIIADYVMVYRDKVINVDIVFIENQDGIGFISELDKITYMIIDGKTIILNGKIIWFSFYGLFRPCYL